MTVNDKTLDKLQEIYDLLDYVPQLARCCEGNAAWAVQQAAKISGMALDVVLEELPPSADAEITLCKPTVRERLDEINYLLSCLPNDHGEPFSKGMSADDMLASIRRSGNFQLNTVAVCTTVLGGVLSDMLQNSTNENNQQTQLAASAQ
jgi:hypothetical protein